MTEYISIDKKDIERTKL